jgi:cellobiose phosphorylase
LLGVRPEWDGLCVKPCIGQGVPEFTITRKCRGATYRIHVKSLGGTGNVKLTVDGKAIDGVIVPYAAPGSTVNIECEAS